MTDDELVARMGCGDEEAFQLLYTRHTPAVYGLLGRLSDRAADARGLTQETWLRAVRHQTLYRGQSAFPIWLTGIALNCYREWRRRHPRDYGFRPDPDAPLGGDRPRGTQTVRDLLPLLPPEHREVLVLHDIEGFALEDLAAALELEVTTAQSRLARARHCFRQRWQAAGSPSSVVGDMPTGRAATATGADVAAGCRHE